MFQYPLVISPLDLVWNMYVSLCINPDLTLSSLALQIQVVGAFGLLQNKLTEVEANGALIVLLLTS